MFFRNIMITALVSAVISGLVLGTLQSFSTVPIIYGAEAYEVAELAPQSHALDEHSHSHSHNAEAPEWSPIEGVERVSYTFIADILIAFGHSLLLISFMALLFLKFGKPKMSLKSGLLVGFGGYLAFFVATSLGLPPEVPGTISANLHDRQIWWLLTIVASIAGLTTLYLASGALKILGLALIVAPHLIGAPIPEVHGFLNQDPTAIGALEKLEQQFLMATAWVNLVYWLVLGAVSGGLGNRLLKVNKAESIFSQTP